MNPRKFPRTMQQAFGPYTDNRIYEPVQPMHRHDKIVTTACALALACLLASLFIWGCA